MREHPSPNPFAPVVRCAADLLAVVPHTLGYWPADSLVLLAAGGGTAGACVRVDLPAAAAPGAATEHFVRELAELVGHDTLSDRVFVVVYTSAGAGTAGPAERAAAVLTLAEEAAARAGREVAARWVVAGERWWPAEDPGDVQAVAGILDSAVNAALVASGSSWAAAPRRAMDHEYGALPAGTDRSAAAAARRWVREGRGTWHRLTRVHELLGLWDRVLVQVGGAGEDWLPRLLALDDDLLGCLAAGWTDPVLADLLLASCATGRPRTVGAAAALWAQLCEELPDEEPVPPSGAHGTPDGDPPGTGPAAAAGPTRRAPSVPVPALPAGPGSPGAGDPRPAPGEPGPDAGALILLTRVLAGEWERRPDWERLDALYRVLLALSWLLEPGDGSAAADPEDGPDPTALAGVLVGLAQLNRLRARGSHTAHFVRRATALVPDHPGALRVLRLAAARPVPRWARDRRTAWHG